MLNNETLKRNADITFAPQVYEHRFLWTELTKSRACLHYISVTIECKSIHDSNSLI